MAFSALYDADVLIPHEIRDILMISASTRTHAVYWSEDIFAEWLKNATSKQLASKESVLRFQSIMNLMFPDALLARIRYELLIDSMTNDPKDRHVLAAAVLVDADIIVTRNISDYPKDSVEKYQIEVQTPDQFVRHQTALNPLLFLEKFLARAHERNAIAISKGKSHFLPADIALFLRDGPSDMKDTGEFILQLLQQFPS